MKRTVAIILALAAMLPFAGQAAYPIHANSKTVNVEKVTGQWNSWNWTWVGRNSQSNTATVLSGTAPIDLTNAVLAFKMSQNTATGRVTFVNTTNVAVSASSNVIWTVDATNIPPNGSYLSELWSYYGATTNQVRTLAQGTIQVVDSLYLPGDSSYPWPSVETNLADYVLRTDADYLAAVTGAVYAAQSGITKTGRVFNFGTNDFGGGGGAGTITNVGASGGMLTATDPGGPSVVIGLATAAVQAAIAPVGYLTSYTETDPVAATSVWGVAQYPTAVLTDGTRAMGAALNMGGQNITNATGMFRRRNTTDYQAGFTLADMLMTLYGDVKVQGAYATNIFSVECKADFTQAGSFTFTTNEPTSGQVAKFLESPAGFKRWYAANDEVGITNGQTGLNLGLGAGSSYAGNVIATGYLGYVTQQIGNAGTNGQLLGLQIVGGNANAVWTNAPSSSPWTVTASNAYITISGTNYYIGP